MFIFVFLNIVLKKQYKLNVNGSNKQFKLKTNDQTIEVNLNENIYELREINYGRAKILRTN